jgi:hypothetical protein
MPSERTPLLSNHAHNFWDFSTTQEDYHTQFCKLVGIPPSDLPADQDRPDVPPKSLYGRALKFKKNQQLTYGFTAAISNTLLLSQVVLGAAVTALGASESSHILITLFGALNTIIAGVVAYLKSRGQPMRARMFRDDLERVVDEIENSEIMWRGQLPLPASLYQKLRLTDRKGISSNVHGYDEIDTSDAVTVRSEVARLTRLYDRAVRSNTVNNPDMYQGDGGGAGSGIKLRQNVVPGLPAAAVVGVGPGQTEVGEVPKVVVVEDPDASPASAPVVKKEEKTEVKEDKPAVTGEAGASKDAGETKPADTAPNGDAAPTAEDKGKGPAID